jgi:hypothetical protein
LLDLIRSHGTPSWNTTRVTSAQTARVGCGERREPHRSRYSPGARLARSRHPNAPDRFLAA